MLPFSPEASEEAAVGKIKAALGARLWNIEDTMRAAAAAGWSDKYDRPGSNPEHVVDFPDGMRLIVSTEDYGHGDPVTPHVSMSVVGNTSLSSRMAIALHVHGNGAAFMQSLLDSAAARFKAATGRDDLELAFVTDAGVPHWFSREFLKSRRIQDSLRRMQGVMVVFGKDKAGDEATRRTDSTGLWHRLNRIRRNNLERN